MFTNQKIEQLRKDYAASTLEIEKINRNPVSQFEQWFEEALSAEVPEPNAMVLSTATPEGVPSARVVLLKGIMEGGFVFYTNYLSRKGQELKTNPHASLTFLWHELQRQVRIEGVAELLSDEASTAYFQSRPKGSQIGAWASPQSEVIDSRDILEDNVERLQLKYGEEEVLPRPGHWGGYKINPSRIEFWQGRSSRLHDRLVFERQGDEWALSRLAP
ncbi:MAG: pyridoxamine 5'-phosphate oxidase [Phaeodactylibacter sp.]|nr:pyridoxamine 5'-phosphate oxidase [Phaeodactylibacter sp.]